MYFRLWRHGMPYIKPFPLSCIASMSMVILSEDPETPNRLANRPSLLSVHQHTDVVKKRKLPHKRAMQGEVALDFIYGLQPPRPERKAGPIVFGQVTVGCFLVYCAQRVATKSRTTHKSSHLFIHFKVCMCVCVQLSSVFTSGMV